MAPWRHFVWVLGLMSGCACAGEWSLRFGDTVLEGISVDERVAGERYHLGLASDTVWFTFTFPAAAGERPARAVAEHIDLNGFDPDIRCSGLAEGALLLVGYELRGQVSCSRPAGTVDLAGRFEN